MKTFVFCSLWFVADGAIKRKPEAGYRLVNRGPEVQWVHCISESMRSKENGRHFADNFLTHNGLVTLYRDIDMGQHLRRQRVVAWRYQAIT